MKLRKAAESSIALSELGIGTWELAGDVWGQTEDRESKRAIATGIECGATYIDTAAGYGDGHVETLIGEMIASGEIDRTSTHISTKVIPKNLVWAPNPDVSIADVYPPEWIIEQTHKSLERLQTDYIDTLFMHTWRRAWAAEERWLEAIAELKDDGLIGAVGISGPDERPDDANTFIATGQIDAVQLVLNVFQQEPVWTVLPIATKNDVAVIARSPFSSGALVQGWTTDMNFPEGDWRATWPLGVKPQWLENQCEMADSVKPILEATGLSYAQAALRFILDYAVTSVIPGSANADHVRENMTAAGVSRLDEQVHADLVHLWSTGKIAGTYNGSV